MIYKSIIAIVIFVIFSGCNESPKRDHTSSKIDTVNQSSNPIQKTDSLKNFKSVEIPDGIITKLPTDDKIIALTFDACETKTTVHFDEGILSYLLTEKIPFTIFMSGKFAKTNRERLTELSKIDFIEIENHSLNHNQHMERLNIAQVKDEVMENEKLLFDITGKKTKLFRFPGGNYNENILETVESLGYRVVHWRIPTGDPDKHVTKARLVKWVLYITHPGEILIFHINGRGYKTAESLPEIIDNLKKQGYSFTKLEDYIK